MNVMGLDLSLTATGVARANGSTFTVKTNAKRKDYRLEDIYTAVYAAAGDADLAVLEDLPYSARMAGVTGMVQGVVRLALIRQNVSYAFVSPATLKKFATGNGKADKPMMAAALIDHYYDTDVVEVDEKGKQYLPSVGVELTDNDQVDAAWLRLAGLTWLNTEPKLASRRSLLGSGKWAGWSFKI